MTTTFDQGQALAVRLQGVTKTFGNITVVPPLDLEIRENEFFSILGPSGCGKTTLMRMITGFETPTAGNVELAGKNVDGVSTRDRDLNMLFQSYALFPHLTVYENVAFELRVRKAPKAEIDRRVRETLELVRLQEFADRKPAELSGGQRQRVALARAVVGRPAVVLLDEPLGALDQKLRKEMQVELKRMQREVGITFIYVTHDQEEALTMSDRIAVMSAGRIVQLGTPTEIYDEPRNKFVASFIGSCNVFDVLVDRTGNNSGVTIDGIGTIPANIPESVGNGEAAVALRPERISASVLEPLSGWSLKGTLTERIFLGNEWDLRVSVGGTQGIELSVRIPSGGTHAAATDVVEGGTLWLQWEASAASVLSETTHTQEVAV